MNFTTLDRSNKNKRIKIWAVLVWLILWEITARFIGQEILLVSPFTVVWNLMKMAGKSGFWKSVLFTVSRIAGGFLLAFFTGTILAWAGSVYRFVRELAAPLMAVIKAAPVASFIILLLIWIPSRNLSFIISFLIALPVIYTNVLYGIENTNKELLEMAKVFKVPLRKRIWYIYLSETLPYLRAACSISLGLCWKAGVAAEVIGIPSGSIGERLYEAKIYLQTPDLFAWTLTIILLSIWFEKIFLYTMDKVIRVE